MDGPNMMELEQEFAQALQRTAKKIAEAEGCSYQEGLVRIVNVLANLKVQWLNSNPSNLNKWCANWQTLFEK